MDIISSRRAIVTTSRIRKALPTSDRGVTGLQTEGYIDRGGKALAKRGGALLFPCPSPFFLT